MISFVIYIKKLIIIILIIYLLLMKFKIWTNNKINFAL